MLGRELARAYLESLAFLGRVGETVCGDRALLGRVVLKPGEADFLEVGDCELRAHHVHTVPMRHDDPRFAPGLLAHLGDADLRARLAQLLADVWGDSLRYLACEERDALGVAPARDLQAHVGPGRELVHQGVQTLGLAIERAETVGDVHALAVHRGQRVVVA